MILPAPAMRKRIAKRLHFLADRIDPDGACRASGISFEIIEGRGVVTNLDREGCPLWYHGKDDYERAFVEAQQQ